MPDTPTPQHTPGPWEAWNAHGGRTLAHWRVGERNSTPGIVRPVAVVCNNTDGRSAEESYANAFLIAAAPDLLAASIELVRTIDTMPDDTERGRVLRCALNNRAGDMLREAIAKATT